MLLLLKELVMKKDVLLKQIATKLFYEQGWVLTSVAEICRVADVSRVTFYKYFPTKQALVKCIFEEQKNKMREDFDNLLDTQSDLSQIITKILSMQQDSMETLYSVPVYMIYITNRIENYGFFLKKWKKRSINTCIIFLVLYKNARLSVMISLSC